MKHKLMSVFVQVQVEQYIFIICFIFVSTIIII